MALARRGAQPRPATCRDCATRRCAAAARGGRGFFD